MISGFRDTAGRRRPRTLMAVAHVAVLLPAFRRATTPTGA